MSPPLPLFQGPILSPGHCPRTCYSLPLCHCIILISMQYWNVSQRNIKQPHFYHLLQMAPFLFSLCPGIKLRSWPGLQSHGLKFLFEAHRLLAEFSSLCHRTLVSVFHLAIFWKPLPAPGGTYSVFPVTPIISSQPGDSLSAGQLEYVSLTFFLTERKLYF